MSINRWTGQTYKPTRHPPGTKVSSSNHTRRDETWRDLPSRATELLLFMRTKKSRGDLI